MLESHTVIDHCVVGRKGPLKAVKTVFPFHVRGGRHRFGITLNCLVAHILCYIQVWCVFNFVENRIT